MRHQGSRHHFRGASAAGAMAAITPPSAARAAQAAGIKPADLTDGYVYAPVKPGLGYEIDRWKNVVRSVER